MAAKPKRYTLTFRQNTDQNRSINLQAPISLITPEVRDILASTGYFSG
jgi:hypothetical protein